jgi:hypothetical protein
MANNLPTKRELEDILGPQMGCIGVAMLTFCLATCIMFWLAMGNEHFREAVRKMSMPTTVEQATSE